VITASEFRALVLALPDTTEGAHHGHPDFRVNGRIFATLDRQGERGMVKLPVARQRAVLAEDPAFSPAQGGWGKQGCTMVDLARASSARVEAAVHEARQDAMAQPPPKRKSTSSSRRRSPPQRDR
jgi:hypothetical protein